MIRLEPDALILSFPHPVRTLSWALLNGGFYLADHIVNHHVDRDDAAFAANPRRWLSEQVARLKLNGNVMAMATAVEMRCLTQGSFCSGEMEATCFATVGHSNALTVGDKSSLASSEKAAHPHTINMILLVRPGLRDEGMVEAIQITTEGRVRALNEAGVLSSRSRLPATGTGTDCMAVASLGEDKVQYCGKHTPLGELIGLASYTAVKKGLAKGLATTGL